MSAIFRCLVICVAALTISLVSVANADIVFNNFGAGDAFGNSGLLLQGPAVGTIGDVNQAAAFTVGPTGAMLTSIQLGISTGGPGPGTGPIDVLLAADAAGLPGATLRSSLVNVNMTGKQVISAPFDGSLLLAANTTYWVVADAEGTFDGGWYLNTTGNTGPTAGQTEGFPWNLHAADQRFAFRVQGRLVPEPASLVLSASGVIAVLACGRRRRFSW
jgi:PEP-CTERM motif